MKLTEKIVAALTLPPPPGKDELVVSDDDTTGLYFRIRRNGNGKIKRSWFYRYPGGKPSVGYPAFTLTAARVWAGQMQAKVRLGGNPAQERREGKDRALSTMGSVLPAYLEHKQRMLRPRPYDQVQRHLNKYFAPLHRYPLTAITLTMVAARSAAIASTSGATTAKNSCRSLHAFFVWCSLRGLIDRNPAVGIEHQPDRKRDRVLSASEIAALWQATAGDGDFDAIIRLLLLSGCRLSEIGGLRWSEVFSDRIVLPAERTKNKRPHVVPLTTTMQSILDARPRRATRDLVFGRGNVQGFVGWSSPKRKLDARLPKMPHWTMHDLRRTLITGCGELGISPHIVESAVNHTSFRGGTAGHYNWSQYEQPIRQCLAVWERHVLEIAEGRIFGDRVVPLRTAS
jgi:integrase